MRLGTELWEMLLQNVPRALGLDVGLARSGRQRSRGLVAGSAPFGSITRATGARLEGDG